MRLKKSPLQKSMLKQKLPPPPPPPEQYVAKFSPLPPAINNEHSLNH